MFTATKATMENTLNYLNTLPNNVAGTAIVYLTIVAQADDMEAKAISEKWDIEQTLSWVRDDRNVREYTFALAVMNDLFN